MTNPTQLYDSLFNSQVMSEIFSDRATLQGMLDFEAALALAEARTSVIPQKHADAILEKCRAELFDVHALSKAAALAGNVAIPLVKALTAAVAKDDENAARHVHWGATSQDVIDTGLVLQLRQALDFFEVRLLRLAQACADHAHQHRHVMMVGRTWLQHATPITFGLKTAAWLSAIERQRARLAACRQRVLVLQFGGASGTLASLNGRGLDVANELAKQLKLDLPDMPWHTQRDNFAEVASLLSLLTGTLGKIATDISLMMQTEIGEAFEPTAEARGGSSTMPHKRNPVSCAVVLAAAARVPGLASTMHAAMAQEHERGVGGWQAEWQTLPQICQLAAGALEHTLHMVEGLEIDPVRMRANLEMTKGLVLAEAASMALAVYIGREKAHLMIEQASQRAITEKRHLRDVLASDAQVAVHMDNASLNKLFEPQNYLGMAEQFIDRVLAARKLN